MFPINNKRGDRFASYAHGVILIMKYPQLWYARRNMSFFDCFSQTQNI